LDIFEFPTMAYEPGEVVDFVPWVSLAGGEIREMLEMSPAADAEPDFEADRVLTRWMIQHQVAGWTLRDQAGQVLPPPHQDPAVLDALDATTEQLLGQALSRLTFSTRQEDLYVYGRYPYRVCVENALVRVVATPGQVAAEAAAGAVTEASVDAGGAAEGEGVPAEESGVSRRRRRGKSDPKNETG
jgi:hypothetical protein